MSEEYRRAHHVMTADEYSAMQIKGWHEVCRDVDGFGGVGVRFVPETIGPCSMPDCMMPDGGGGPCAGYRELLERYRAIQRHTERP